MKSTHPKLITEFAREIVCDGDICDTRRCRLRLTKTMGDHSAIGNIGFFDLGNLTANGGMAFPEVLRTYSELFSQAADFIERQSNPQAAREREALEYRQLMGEAA